MRILGNRSLAALIKLFIDLVYYFAIFAMGAFAIVTFWLFFFGGERVSVQVPIQFELDSTDHPVSSSKYVIDRAEFKEAKGILSIDGLGRIHILFQAGIGLLTLGVSLVVLNQLRAIFGSLRERHPFHAANAGRIRIIAVVVILGEILSKAVLALSSATIAEDISFSGLGLTSSLDLDGSILFLGLVLMIISEMIRLGSQMRADLEMAREIQLNLVPAEDFRSDQITIKSHMRPANTVGGDYYDLITLGENKLGLVLGDVSGKGMPAAMLMASLQGSLRTLISAGFRGKDLIGKLNAYLCENTPDNRLVTLFYGELDLPTGSLRYVNAGHNAPFWLQGEDGVQSLESTTMALGISESTSIHENNIQLQPNDQLLLFTDGISEAFDKKLEPFGEGRLSQCLIRYRNLSPSDLIHRVIKEVYAFSGSSAQSDDMTLMVIHRAPSLTQVP